MMDDSLKKEPMYPDWGKERRPLRTWWESSQWIMGDLKVMLRKNSPHSIEDRPTFF